MFNFLKTKTFADFKPTHDTLAENERLKQEIHELERMVEKIQDKYDALVRRDLDTSSFAFDFNNNKINAFSIERILYNDSWDKNVPKTVIGYVLEGNPVESREWTLNCNSAQHEKLVQQFNESRRSFQCMP